MYADCVDLVTKIGDVQFKHCVREANIVAHEVAKHCYENGISCHWVDNPPSFIFILLGMM